MKKTFKLVVLFLLLIASNTQAQEKKAEKKEKKKKSIKEIIKGHQEIEGLFKFYRDSLDGSLMMVIKKEQLEKEFLYFNQISKGAPDIRRIRGQFLFSRLLTFKKHYNKIEVIAKNQNYYHDPSNSISKASKGNIRNSILASLQIEALDSLETQYLVKVDNLFKTHSLGYSKPPKVSGLIAAFIYGAGGLDKDKTKIINIQNFPENTGIEVEYVYTKSNANSRGPSPAIADFRSVSVTTYHHLIKAPQNDFVSRKDDSRVGFFTHQITDLTSTSVTPYKDVILRWNLKKKLPNRKISEPVKPIVYWMENTTPAHFRPTIKEAIFEWNKAFEKAGFKNAIVLKQQPDDAHWKAEDIRYNVIRWINSPKSAYSGYGPNFSDPRTGQIIGADIMLEYSSFKRSLNLDKVFNQQNSNTTEIDNLEVNALENHFNHQCTFGNEIKESILFGNAVVGMLDYDSETLKRLEKESLKSLVMHEVGHTLGLMHNMKSSQLHSPEQLNDKDFINGKSLTGSVMDYNMINLADDLDKQGHFFNSTIGPYDYWAIEFGYKEFSSKHQKEAHLARSTDANLQFGNDSEDVRKSGTQNIDPRIMTWDLSNDAISYSIKRMKIIEKLRDNLKEKFYVNGNSYNEMFFAYQILNGQFNTAASVISRYVGGIYQERSTIGQQNVKIPYKAVPYKDQKRAIKALNELIFTPDAFGTDNRELFYYLVQQRRAFSGPQQVNIHRLVLNNQKSILRHLLSSSTLDKVIYSNQLGSKYSLNEYLNDLVHGIFQADRKSEINSYRKNLQNYFLTMIINTFQSSNSGTITAAMFKVLKDIQKMVSNKKGSDATKAHKQLLSLKINNLINSI